MANPSPELLNQIADRLSLPIPKPAAPVARARASWRTLKVSQELLLKDSWFRAGFWFQEGMGWLPAGTKVTVSKTDTLGITLTHYSEEGTLTELRWTDPEWKGMFEKVRKGRKKKDGKAKEEG